MSRADELYKELVVDIHKNGTWDKGEEVRTVYEDGTPAYSKSWIAQSMRFDNTEIPILTTKKVAWKTAIKELLWIWQMKSNKVQDLRDMGVTIWDNWELDDGTIGKAYGYQLGKKTRIVPYLFYLGEPTAWTKIDQVDYLLHQLKRNPASRRHITTLWNPDELDDMALNPCVYETQWHVKQSKLHLEVRCRSNDIALGNPFNVFQYNVLHRMMAQITGYELGEYIYHIGDAHVYDRHWQTINEQIYSESFVAPTLWINPKVKNFYDFTIDDFELRDYKHGEKRKFEVAI
jgi:thymidylate synthase